MPNVNWAPQRLQCLGSTRSLEGTRMRSESIARLDCALVGGGGRGWQWTADRRQGEPVPTAEPQQMPAKVLRRASSMQATDTSVSLLVYL